MGDQTSDSPGDVLPDVFVLVHESRSGSTFLADILSRHPEISIAPESSILRNVWRWRKSHPRDRIATRDELVGLVRALFQEEKLKAWGIQPEPVIEELTPRLPVPSGTVARVVIVHYGQARHPGSRVFGLKRGGWNAFNLDSVRVLLPNVRCIHIVRDGRAVYASEKRAIHRLTGRPFQQDAGVAAWRWQHTVRSFRKAAEWGLEVKYEELLRTPQPILAETLSYLGVDPASDLIEKMLRPHESNYVPDYVANLHHNVGKPPLIERIDGWRRELSPAEIRTFERIAGETLIDKGYERTTPRRPWESIFKHGIELRQRLNRIRGPRMLRKAGSK